MKTTLINICESNGWTATTDSAGKDVIYKGNLYIMVDVTTGSFNSLGITGRTGVNEGSTPGRVGISDFYQCPHSSYYPCPGPVQFPVKYYCFTYSDIDEVYFLINYADMYQWIAFGKSNITLPGTGLWVAGTSGSTSTSKPAYIVIQTTGDVSFAYSTSSALFWSSTGMTGGGSRKNYWLHSNINPSYPWSLARDDYSSYNPIGVRYLTTHLESQPNEYNQQSLFLPILAYHTSHVYSGYYTLAAHIQKARHLMINYLDPETIIYHGDEQWMVFPYFKKVYQSPYTFSLSYVVHSGNFGWAIKKEA